MGLIQLPRTQERIIPPEERVKNFDEIVKSYTEDEAVLEASRCVLCQDAPCVKACPTAIDIPRFIDRIRIRDFEGAINTIRLTNNLPNVCARVCPVEVLCEGSCVWHEKAGPVSIGLLQRFAADYQVEKIGLPVFQNLPKTAGRVAVVGSGPAGLGVAADLAKMNYDVTVFEERGRIGGLVRDGIMTTRLPTKAAEFDIEYIKRLGVRFVTGKRVEDLDELLTSFDAVYIGSGMRIPRRMDIPGEDLDGVVSALPVIEGVIDRVSKNLELPSYQGKRVVVVGGGDTAMDAVSTALRLGAEKVSLVYRRSMKEMPAYFVEVKFAEEEKGVEFFMESMPVRILGKDKVERVRCVKVSQGLKPLGGTEFEIDADIVLVAVGQEPNVALLSEQMGLKLNPSKSISVDRFHRTSKDGVFAGGDATNVGGRATVVKALGESRVAAKQIHEYVVAKKQKKTTK